MEQQDPAACGDDCADALARLEAFLDGELPGETLESIGEHLRACYPCTDRATFEQQLRELVKRGCAEQAPPELVARIRAQILTPARGTDPS